MKKSLLITLDFPPNVGGVAYYLSSLCKHLPSKSITIVTPETKEADRFDQRQRYKIIRKKILSRYFWPRWLFFVLKAYKIIKKEGIEVIVVGQLLPIGTVALLIKKLFDIPYIVSTHAMDVTILQKMPRKKILARKVLRAADKVVTVSLYTKKELLKLGVDRQSIEIISPATNILNRQTSIAADQVKERYHLADKMVLFTLGRLVQRKGHDTVIKALSQIVKKYPQVNYLIGSEGEYQSKLTKLVHQYQLEKNVIFAGPIPDNEIPAYYQACDVFVMISRELNNRDVEGFGIVYLEAGAFGKPVIAGASGGVGDVVQNNYNGLLIDPNNVNDAQNAIVRLIENKELRQKLGKNGQAMVKNNYTWPGRANRLMKILT